MKDGDKTKEQLIDELMEMRQRLAELEAADAERKRVEEALRESEEKYRVMAEGSSSGIFISDAERFIYVNQRFCEITGFSKDELLSMPDPVGSLFAPEERERVLAYARSRLSGGPAPIHYEARGIRKDGEEISLKLTVSSIVLSGRRVLQGAVEDITERKRAEEEIRQRNRELAALNAIATVVSQSLNLDEILNAALDKVLELMNLNVGGIYLADAERRKLDLVVHRGTSKEFAHEIESVSVDEKTLEAVMAEGRLRRFILSVEAVIKDRGELKRIVSAMKKEGLSFTSAAPVLLQAKEDIVGLMIVASRVPRQFSEAELELLASIGQQIATAIENARLYKETRRRAEELGLLFQVARHISASLQPAEVMYRLAEFICQAASATSADVLVLDETGTRATVVAQYIGPHASPSESRPDDGTVYDLTRHPTILEMVRTGRPVITHADDPTLDPATRQMMAQFGGCSALRLPLLFGGVLRGYVLVWDSRMRHEWDHDTVRLCQTLAGSAAVALENARLYENTRRRALEQETVSRITYALNTPDVREAFPVLVEGLHNLTGCDVVNLVVMDEAGEQFIISVLESPFPIPGEGEAMPLSAMAAAEDVVAGRPHLTADLSTETHFPFEQALYQAGLRSRVALPLLVGGEAFGALNLGGSRTDLFREDQLPVLQQIADAVALAFENSLLFQAEHEQRERAQALEEAVAVVSSTLDPDQVLDRILEQVSRVVPNDAANVMLIEGDQARVVRWRGYERFGTEELVSTVVFRIPEVPNLQQMMESREPMVIPDTAAYPNWVRVPVTEWLRSYAAAPIKVRGEVIGFLNVDSATPGFFTQAHAEALRAFADHAAAAIENARLYEAEQERRRIAETLRQASTVFSSTLELSEVLELILQQLRQVIPYDSASVQRLEDECLEIVACQGFEEPDKVVSLTFPLDPKFPNHRVVTTKAPLAIEDVVQDYPHFKNEADTYESGRIRSWMGVPLMIKDEVIGMIAVDRVEVQPYTVEETQLAMAFANQAAIAIETARLFAETEGRANDLALLLDTSTAISSTLDLDRILETVAQQITTSLVATFCRISLLDETGENLVIRAASPVRGQKAEEGLGRRCPLAMVPWHRQVIEAGQPVVLRQDVPELALSDEECKTALTEEVKSAALIPLIVGGRVLGVVSLGEERSWERSPFTPSKVELCQSIARQAAVAIENARLYEETQQRLQELAILMESGATIVSAFDMKQLLSKVAELMTLSIGVEACGISSWEREEGVVRTLAEYSSAVQVVEGGATYQLDDYPATAQLLHSGQPFQVRVDDPTADERERVLLEEWAMKSVLALPIVGESGVVGLLELYDGERARTFSPEEIACGQVWAKQMASLVERVLMLEGADQEKLSRALRQLAVQAMRDLDLDWCAISRWDRAGERVVTLAECGDVIWPKEAGASYPLADYPATAHVLHQRQPLVVLLDDPTADERERALLEEEGWEAMLALPMVVRDEVIGLVELFDRRPRPFTAAEIELAQTLANQAAIALENARAQEELQRSFEKLQRTLEGTVNVLVSAIEMRDPYTGSHQRRVTQLACAIASEMGLPEEQIEGIRMAGLIHDVGKINIPAEILSKPGELDDIEYGLIKMHVQAGHDVLKEFDFPWPVAQIVLQHHERLDGSGYPQGLSGDEIMLEARILAVADVVEAMASHRPYRPPRGLDKALEEISQNRGVLYDPEVVDVCLKLFTEKGFKLK